MRILDHQMLESNLVKDGEIIDSLKELVIEYQIGNRVDYAVFQQSGLEWEFASNETNEFRRSNIEMLLRNHPKIRLLLLLEG
jgi:hypothetical protein